MSEISGSLKEKYQTALDFLEQDFMLLHLNPRNDGVELPQHLLRSESVTLKLSRYFRGALEVHPDRISAELLFDGSYYTCIVPFTAVWGCSSASGKNTVWPDSTPPEVLQSLLQPSSNISQPRQKATIGSLKKPDNKRNHLKRVK